MKRTWRFGSLFLGGFECSTHLTAEGYRLDMVAATQHDSLAREDYALCRSRSTSRTSATWRDSGARPGSSKSGT